MLINQNYDASELKGSGNTYVITNAHSTAWGAFNVGPDSNALAY